MKHLLLLSCLALSTLSIEACTPREVPMAQAAFQIPALKPRLASLSPNEFKMYRSKYDELTQKILAKPNEPGAYVEMAQLFMNEARITGDHPYYYPAAMSLLEQALKLDPKHFAALISKGSIQLSLHQFKAAAETGKLAASISPYSNFPWGIICDASVELGDYQTAVIAADTMVAIRPDLRSYARVSYLREIFGDIDGAIQAMTMAVKAGAPGLEEKAWARHTLGNLYLNHGKLDLAEQQFQLALTERSNYAFAIAGLARVEIARDHYDRALHLLDSASALMPEFSFAELKADILHVQGDRAGEATVVHEVEKMLKEDEAAGHAVDREMAMLYATRGMSPEKAEVYARKEYAKRPNNIDAQLTLAIACLRAGKTDEASTLIDKATSVQRGNIRNAEHAAYASLIAQAKGDHAKASQMAKVARQINPHLPLLLDRELKTTIGS